MSSEAVEFFVKGRNNFAVGEDISKSGQVHGLAITLYQSSGHTILPAISEYEPAGVVRTNQQCARFPTNNGTSCVEFATQLAFSQTRLW